MKIPHPHTQYALVVLSWSSFAGGLIAGQVGGWLSVAGLLVSFAGVAVAHWLVPNPERVAMLHREGEGRSGGGGDQQA
jgi:hypothetical protein